MEKGNSREIIVKQLTQDLEDLKIFLKDLWQFLPLPVSYLNSNQIILDVNPALEEFFGQRAIDLIGKRGEVLFPDLRMTEEIYQEFLKGEKIVRKETEVIAKEKKRKIVQVFASKREDLEGNFIGYYLAFSDITEWKKVQENLEEKIKEIEKSKIALMNILEDAEETRIKAKKETRKTLAIIENFADGLLVFDKENRLSLINTQAEALFQIKKESLRGKSIAQLKEVSSLRPLIELLGQELKRISREELPIRENLVLEVSTLPIMAEKEKLGSLVVLHDITREKIVERLKTEFVSLSAHQLRTPLSALKWVLKLFLDGDLGEISDEQKSYLEKAYQENERMINLINDLLDVTRIEEGRYITKTSFIQFEKVCQEVVNSFKSQFWQKKISFGLILPFKPLPRIKVDVEKIKLAIQNLIDNSLKYTPSGGQVTISLKPGLKEIEFEIRDNGVGIPEEQKKGVFSKFFRGKNILRLETTGTGLGLFISKNIIEAHGGKIWFESEERKGTTFYFTLPVEK